MRQSRRGITKEFTAVYADGSSSWPPVAASHGGMSSGSTCRRLVEALGSVRELARIKKRKCERLQIDVLKSLKIYAIRFN